MRRGRPPCATRSTVAACPMHQLTATGAGARHGATGRKPQGA